MNNETINNSLQYNNIAVYGDKTGIYISVIIPQLNICVQLR